MPTDTTTGTAGTKRLSAKAKYDLIKRLIAEHPELDNYDIGKLAHAKADTVHFVRSISEWSARPASSASAAALVSFMAAADQHLPLLNTDDLNRARSHVAGSEWRKA